MIAQLINHIPVLHVVIPFFISLISLIFINQKSSQKIFYFLAIFACLLNIILSILFFNIGYDSCSYDNIFYEIGNFDYKIGIAHLADPNSEKIVIYLSILLILFLIRKGSIYKISKNLKLPHLFYFLILINYTGLLGIVLTNDIFNNYVFIEITSLTSYVLSTIKKEKNSLIGGINYLIYGSFAATLILFGVGILLFSCGSLSIRFLSENLEIFNQNIPATIGIIFIFLGFIFKIGIMPFCFVVSRAYKFSSMVIVQYLLSTGFLVNFFAVNKFYKLIGIQHFFSSIGITSIIISSLGITSIIISSYLALKTKNFRAFLTYLIFASNGMSLVALDVFGFDNLDNLFVYYLIFDGINKFGLFLIFSILEKNMESNNFRDLGFRDLIYINDNKLVLSTFLIICISIVGLPFTVGFVGKLSLYSVLVTNNNYYLLAALLVSNLASMTYVFRLINYSYLSIDVRDGSNKKNIVIDCRTRFVLVFVVLILIITCFYA